MNRGRDDVCGDGGGLNVSLGGRNSHHFERGEVFLLTVKLLCLQSLKALIRCTSPL